MPMYAFMRLVVNLKIVVGNMGAVVLNQGHSEKRVLGVWLVLFGLVVLVGRWLDSVSRGWGVSTSITAIITPIITAKTTKTAKIVRLIPNVIAMLTNSVFMCHVPMYALCNTLLLCNLVSD